MDKTETKTVKMLSDEIGADGETLEKGKTYKLAPASADHWIKRGKAETPGEKKDADDKAPEKRADETTGVAVDGQIKREPPAVVGTTESVFRPDAPAKADKAK